MVVRTLLRSLDNSFSHIVLMIKERTNFRELVPADVIERLKTHEMEEEQKHDVNGSRRRTHALKAKASRHSSSDASSTSGVDSDDPSSIGKDLALIMKRFNHFQRKKFLVTEEELPLQTLKQLISSPLFVKKHVGKGQHMLQMQEIWSLHCILSSLGN